MSTEWDWTQKADKRFIGKKISIVRFMTDKEAEGMCWSNRPLVLVLDDKSIIFPQRDDEGNDGGALADTSEAGGWPVLSLGFEKGKLPKQHPNSKEWIAKEHEKETKEVQDALDQKEGEL